MFVISTRMRMQVLIFVSHNSCEKFIIGIYTLFSLSEKEDLQDIMWKICAKVLTDSETNIACGTYHASTTQEKKTRNTHIALSYS